MVLPVGGTTRCRLRSPPSSSPSSPDDDDVDDGMGRGRVITRLSCWPDVFLIRDVLSSADASTLMESAARQGMRVAGMRGTSGDDGGGIPAGSYLTWIDPYDVLGEGTNTAAPDNDDDNDGTGGAAAAASALVSVVRDAISTSRRRISHDAMNDAMAADASGQRAYASDGGGERVRQGGRRVVRGGHAGGNVRRRGGYDYHHDGFGCKGGNTTIK